MCYASELKLTHSLAGRRHLHNVLCNFSLRIGKIPGMIDFSPRTFQVFSEYVENSKRGCNSNVCL